MSIYELESENKILLSELMQKNKIAADNPCGGNGKCGKCKVKVKGNLSPITEKEKELLSIDEILSSYRLACKTYVKGLCKVEVCENEPEYESLNSNEYKTCCAAVDIGTTTLEACFFSLPDFKLIKRIQMKNPQTAFGADVMSRIEFAKDEKSRDMLKEIIHEAIYRLAGDLYDKINYWVISGNTVMLHLYSGINPEKIAFYPFESESLFGFEEENIYYPRCISSYVGADITMAVLASGMLNDKSPSLLCDIGTNGEIVLFDGKSLCSTSTAAGPAFEGVSISQGMPAIKGAIKKVKDDGKVETIDNAKAKGICASGLLDAVCYMLSEGVLKKDGFLEKPFEIGESNVYITPGDIRNIQMAKAAIRAGIETLLEEKNIPVDSLEKIYISGSLGNNLNIKNAIKIGLIPDIDEDKYKCIGNGALDGACMILENDENKNKSFDIAKNTKTYHLSLSEKFSKKYIEYMEF